MASAAPPTVAAELFDRAIALEKDEKHTEACVLFEASAKLERKPGARLGMARCLVREGQVTAALGELRGLMDIAKELPGERGEEIVRTIEAQLRTAESKVATLRVVLPEGAKGAVALDGRVLSEEATRAPILLDPGVHRVEVFTPDGRTILRSLDLEAGRMKEVDLTTEWPAPATVPLAVREAGTPHVKSAGPPTEQPVPAHLPLRTAAGAGLTGLGLASLGAALALGIETDVLVDAAERNKQNLLLDSARSAQTGAFVALGVGAALCAAGVTVLLTASSPARKSGTTGAVTLRPNGASVDVRW